MSKLNQVQLLRCGLTGALFLTQKRLNRAKTEVLQGTKKIIGGSPWGVLMMYKIQITQNNWTIKSSLSGLAARGLYFFLKKRTRNSHFPRPRETDPYVTRESRIFQFENPSILGGGDNPIDNGKSQNLHPSTPKPDSMHKYKTFCLKDHILLRKKRPCPGNITFWPSQAPPQWPNWPKIDVRVIIWDILMHVQFFL